MTSPTPWRADGIKLYDANGDYCGSLEGILNADRELIVSAVNWYSSLPGEVRRLKPETVAKCVDAVKKESEWITEQGFYEPYIESMKDACAALKAETT